MKIDLKSAGLEPARGTPSYYARSNFAKRVTDSLILDCADFITERAAQYASWKRPKGVEAVISPMDNDACNVLAGMVVVANPDSAFNIGIPRYAGDSGSAIWSIQEVRDLKMVRGRVKRLMPRMFGMRGWWPRDGGATFDLYCGAAPDLSGFREITGRETRGYIGNGNDGSYLEFIFKIMLGGYEAESYFWNARFRLPGGATWLSVPVDRRIAMRLFKHREVGSARKRRTALRHLVSEHWRTIEEIDDDLLYQTFVREHLRGSDTFQWFDLECQIAPSRYDVRRLEVALKDRALLRNDGEDRRMSGSAALDIGRGDSMAAIATML